MLLANRATSQEHISPAAIALGIGIALCIAIITARSLVCSPRRDDNRQWGAPWVYAPLTDDMKASRTYTAGARPDESPAAFELRVKKNFLNFKRDQRNQPSKWAGGNLKVQRALIQKNTGHAQPLAGHLCLSRFGVDGRQPAGSRGGVRLRVQQGSLVGRDCLDQQQRVIAIDEIVILLHAAKFSTTLPFYVLVVHQ